MVKKKPEQESTEPGYPMTETLAELDELGDNARLGKDKHFFAAERMKHLNIAFGLPVILINVLLGSVFFSSVLNEEVKEIVGPALAFLAGTLVAIHTFFNFHKSMEGHRNIGNCYIEIMRRCKIVEKGFRDQKVSDEELWGRLQELTDEYHKINRNAETYPPSKSDYKKALAKREARRKTLEESLNIDETASSEEFQDSVSHRGIALFSRLLFWRKMRANSS